MQRPPHFNPRKRADKIKNERDKAKLHRTRGWNALFALRPLSDAAEVIGVVTTPLGHHVISRNRL
ncbi:MAG: hypothetical protein DIZ80_02630 [endosymbiont of Galathealinum brachiosum]|uniref:Uncharacterized protein n=1 Tax=endosymbiont of Galathealinum brachiosum TaxID=2200906 RepID=A0A370DLF0_9GAMM|nr:MAG: hypothetical protein DIZ80_02630 [endosymbiont of Galathealinum brachiosum]